MRVTITCKLNPSRTGIVYATVTCADEVLISATLDYCIAACKDRGYLLENAHDVLQWLNGNVTFSANKY